MRRAAKGIATLGSQSALAISSAARACVRCDDFNRVKALPGVGAASLRRQSEICGACNRETGKYF